MLIILVRFKLNSNFIERRSKNTQISHLMKIRLVGAELFHADVRTDRHDEDNGRFRNFVNALKNHLSIEMINTIKFYLLRIYL